MMAFAVASIVPPSARAQCTATASPWAPSNGASLSVGQVFLGWTVSGSPSSYDVQISTNSSFTSLIIDENVPSFPREYEANLPSSGGTYYWRVRPVCSGTPGSWTSTRSFTHTFVSPVAISTLTAVDCSMNGIQLWWGEPSYGDGGGAQEYEIRYSVNPIDDSNWSSASLATDPTPDTPGLAMTHWVNQLNSCTWYYFAVKWKNHGYDEFPVRTAVWSDVSNNIRAKTKCTMYGACYIEDWSHGLDNEITSAPPKVSEIRRVMPNPATQALSIDFALPSASADVELSVFDMQGRRIAELFRGEAPAGPSRATWDLRDLEGSRVRPGIYLARLRNGSEVRSRAIVIQ
jgi:hypothetical protein